MEKGLQPNALAGTQGSWEQLGLRMPVLRVTGTGSGTSPLRLAHMLSVLLSVNLAASQPCQLQGFCLCSEPWFAWQLLPWSD